VALDFLNDQNIELEMCDEGRDRRAGENGNSRRRSRLTGPLYAG
jgi:hypothetical protein